MKTALGVYVTTQDEDQRNGNASMKDVLAEDGRAIEGEGAGQHAEIGNVPVSGGDAQEVFTSEFADEA